MNREQLPEFLSVHCFLHTVIIPVVELEEAWEYKQQGFTVAAERKGEVVGGFDFGNSPYAFMSEDLAGGTVVLTTSNCTRAIHHAKNAKEVVMGSFLNISALCEHLVHNTSDVMLLCSGWKDRFNLEDSLFAGAIVERVQEHFSMECDAAIAARDLYLIAKPNVREYLRASSHTRRMEYLSIEDDILFCLQEDKVDVVPVFKEGRISSLYPVLV